jgi:hypothetical protein
MSRSLQVTAMHVLSVERDRHARDEGRYHDLPRDVVEKHERKVQAWRALTSFLPRWQRARGVR